MDVVKLYVNEFGNKFGNQNCGKGDTLLNLSGYSPQKFSLRSFLLAFWAEFFCVRHLQATRLRYGRQQTIDILTNADHFGFSGRF